MAETPKQKEYRCRQELRKIPLDDARWKVAKRMAKLAGISRSELCAMKLREMCDSGKLPTISARDHRVWLHAQRKRDQVAAPREEPTAIPITGHLKFVPLEEAERIAYAEWVAAGAPMLHGPNVIRKTLKE